LLATALQVAAELAVPADARTVDGGRRIALTPAGRQRLADHAALQQAPWTDPVFREDWIGRALTAQHTLQRDRDYAVDDDAVVFIDPVTGRGSPERRWSRGLHQLLAAKEGLVPPQAQETIAQLTYQRLFTRYHRLGGLSGTVGEAALEMAATYGLPVVRVPRHRPSRLRIAPPRVVSGRDAWLAAVAQAVRDAQADGRPVLVGTDSVADSQALADGLRAAGLRPVVLNAVHSALEHEVVARAGQPGRLTIATQMAGRGTDIRLGEGVADRGGLHVVVCTVQAGRRHWRQLVGRAGRQGDPGSAQTVLCADRGLLARWLPAWVCRLAVGRPGVAAVAWWLAGWCEEGQPALQRRRLARADREMNRRIAFSGPEA
jgi:preprotein translocase subunit SecA